MADFHCAQSTTTFAKYMDDVSNIFMSLGRSAPQLRDLALLYQRSQRLQDSIHEYFIALVDICTSIVKFGQKSALTKWATSITDTDLKKRQTEGEAWAVRVREEAELLKAQRIESEASENGKFRTEIRRFFSDEPRRRERLQRQTELLDAISSFNHLTAWKQLRKRGNASAYADWGGYQEWLSRNQSSSLIIRGILGSGKSVILSNIAESLAGHNHCALAIFFCKHDVPESLLARTIVGSLSAGVY